MKRLEIRLLIDIYETQTTAEDVIFHLDTAINDIVEGVVKDVDLIREIEIQEYC